MLRAIQEFYGVGADTFEDILKNRDADFDDAHLRDEANVIDEDDAEASVVKFVNQIIREALDQRATDIHLEPVQDSLRIRYRIDGVLHELPVPENIKALQGSVLARVKVMAKLDIAEKRLPQDGRINLKLENQSIDVRVATIPSVEGESISLRLLGQETIHDRAPRAHAGLPREDRRSSSEGRTASSSSPARPAAARPPRSTPSSPRSTTCSGASSPSRIRWSTSSPASCRSR